MCAELGRCPGACRRQRLGVSSQYAGSPVRAPTGFGPDTYTYTQTTRMPRSLRPDAAHEQVKEAARSARIHDSSPVRRLVTTPWWGPRDTGDGGLASSILMRAGWPVQNPSSTTRATPSARCSTVRLPNISRPGVNSPVRGSLMGRVTQYKQKNPTRLPAQCFSIGLGSGRLGRVDRALRWPAMVWCAVLLA